MGHYIDPRENQIWNIENKLITVISFDREAVYLQDTDKRFPIYSVAKTYFYRLQDSHKSKLIKH